MPLSSVWCSIISIHINPLPYRYTQRTVAGIGTKIGTPLHPKTWQLVKYCKNRTGCIIAEQICVCRSEFLIKRPCLVRLRQTCKHVIQRLNWSIGVSPIKTLGVNWLGSILLFQHNRLLALFCLHLSFGLVFALTGGIYFA